MVAEAAWDSCWGCCWDLESSAAAAVDMVVEGLEALAAGAAVVGSEVLAVGVLVVVGPVGVGKAVVAKRVRGTEWFRKN